MTIEILDDQKKFTYYVTYIDQGPYLVYGSFFATQDRPVETEADVNRLKRIAGAKDEHDKHIVILGWKRLQ